MGIQVTHHLSLMMKIQTTDVYLHLFLLELLKKYVRYIINGLLDGILFALKALILLNLFDPKQINHNKQSMKAFFILSSI